MNRYANHTLAELQAILSQPSDFVGEPVKRRVRDELDRRAGKSLAEVGLSGETQAPAAQRVRRMKLCLPLPPSRNYAHSSRHWSSRYASDEAWRAVADALRAFGALPSPPPVPYTRVRLSAILYVWSPSDPTNAAARMKVPEDWLVSAGYVVDDKEANVEWAGYPKQVVDRTCPRLVLVLSQPKEE